MCLGTAVYGKPILIITYSLLTVTSFTHHNKNLSDLHVYRIQIKYVKLQSIFVKKNICSFQANKTIKFMSAYRKFTFSHIHVHNYTKYTVIHVHVCICTIKVFSFYAYMQYYVAYINIDANVYTDLFLQTSECH